MTMIYQDNVFTGKLQNFRLVHFHDAFAPKISSFPFFLGPDAFDFFCSETRKLRQAKRSASLDQGNRSNDRHASIRYSGSLGQSAI